ncbi:MAG: hypothetical protein AB8I08_40205 [Sandaracinaceae bacterium]
MKRSWLLSALLLTASHAAVAQSADPLAAAGSHDPMELARAVDRLGDEALLTRLSDDDRATRLTAIRASPWMRGPELALDPLSELAIGRDPELAPAAMQASVRIARGLDAGTLFVRESPPEGLQGAAARYRALADDDTARPDLRAAARVVVAQLADAGASGEPTSE